MNFQLSVIVWTVICFVALMAILRNLLFVPVLKVLDERKEKIDSAKEKKAEIERLTKEYEERFESEKQEALLIEAKKAKQLASEINAQGKKEIDEAQKQCLEEIRKYKESIADEHEQIVQSVAPKMETAAAILAKNIITHRI